MRLFLLDDNLAYRSQIGKTLSTQGAFEVVGSSRFTETIRPLIESKNPDVLVFQYSEGALSLFTELRSKKGKPPLTVALIEKREHHGKALACGAEIIIEKHVGESGDALRVARLVEESLKSHGGRRPETSLAKAVETKQRTFEKWSCRAIVIASSTGGPPALEAVFSQLRPPLDVPVFIAQHMPESFTKGLADRLSAVSQLTIREAIDGEIARGGTVYIAPGNFHMRLHSEDRKTVIRLDQGEKIHSVRPAADFLFHTAAEIYQKDLVGFVFTGMGADGADGAKKIKAVGGHVVIQDKESSAVWGMPGAAHALGAFDLMHNLDGMALVLRHVMQRSKG